MLTLTTTRNPIILFAIFSLISFSSINAKRSSPKWITNGQFHNQRSSTLVRNVRSTTGSKAASSRAIINASTVTSSPPSTSTNIASAPAAETNTVQQATEVATTNPEGGGKVNPVTQLCGYVWNSMVQFKDGTMQLYSNHQVCNSIRQKRKTFLNSIPETERASTKRTGLTYQDYAFLQKGKEDKGKLGQIIFLMVFSPNFVPYAFMFFPNMLPSPFARGDKSAGVNDLWVESSRRSAHAVIQTMMDLEYGAKHPAFSTKFNPFGRAGAKKAMEQLEKVGEATEAFLATAFPSAPLSKRKREESNGALSPSSPPEQVLEMLHNQIYTSEEGEDSKKEKAKRTKLVVVPKPIVKGLGIAVGINSGPLSGFMPNFLSRNKLVEHLTKLSETDNFLINEEIDLTDIDGELLVDACSARLIGHPGSTAEELRQGLGQWLHLAVAKPNKVIAQSDRALAYNENLARVALMGYNAVDSLREEGSSSRLPRLLFETRW